jgi:hypothetical protein
MLILCGCYTTIRLSPIFPLGPATTCRLTAYKQRLEEYTPSSIVKGYYTNNRATATKKKRGPFDPLSTQPITR